ncbi:MAG: hypothetical protein M5U08_15155 [Burkholderiales bacterium]|nr:hypothetical protein [Burkholderiales bacterium]
MVDEHPAACRREQALHDAQKSGLARAARSHDHAELRLRDAEVEVLQHLDGVRGAVASAARETNRKVLDINQRHDRDRVQRGG